MYGQKFAYWKTSFRLHPHRKPSGVTMYSTAFLLDNIPDFYNYIDNFRFCYSQVTLEQVVNACQIACADHFISELPDKYQTVLGEFGANLSGGQRQRLAIARAIVTDPPILNLDESTGSLDPVTETEMLDKLLVNHRGNTTIIISHGPRVIQRANWIVLLH